MQHWNTNSLRQKVKPLRRVHTPISQIPNYRKGCMCWHRHYDSKNHVIFEVKCCYLVSGFTLVNVLCEVTAFGAYRRFYVETLNQVNILKRWVTNWAFQQNHLSVGIVRHLNFLVSFIFVSPCYLYRIYL